MLGMHNICAFILLFVIKSLASPNFNTDTRLVIINPEDDFHIIYYPNIGWLDVVDLLKEIDKLRVSDLIKKHKNLFVDNTRLAHRSLTSVIRHSMYRMLESTFKKEALDFIERATKRKLCKFLGRLSSYETISNKKEEHCQESIDVFENNFLAQEISNGVKKDSDGAYEFKENNFLVEVGEAIVANKGLEYIDLVTSDPRFSSFLGEIYSLVDKEDKQAQKIFQNTIEMEVMNKEASELLGQPNFGVLSPLLQKSPINKVIESHSGFFRNKDTSFFLQFMVVRHCKLHHLIKKLENIEGALKVFKIAQALKLKDVQERVGKLVAGTYSPPPESLKGSIPETGLDLRNDKIFSQLLTYISRLKLGDDQISRIEDALSIWIDERVQLATVRPQFDNFFKEIFDIINSGQVDAADVDKLVKQV